MIVDSRLSGIVSASLCNMSLMVWLSQLAFVERMCSNEREDVVFTPLDACGADAVFDVVVVQSDVVIQTLQGVNVRLLPFWFKH